MARPHIQVILADDTIPPTLHAALERTPATTGFSPMREAVRAGRMPPADAFVIVLPDDATGVAGPLRVLLDRLAEQPRATLLMSPAGDAEPPFAYPAALPLTSCAGHDAQDLAGRLATMLAMRASLDTLHRGLLDQRRSGKSLAARYLNQLRLASQVQREFLPETLPTFGPVRFDLVFRPVDYVSGDIYDVHRLDEDHVGIAVADATGHGIPAALLTVYIKRALRGKEIVNGSYRVLAPDEVLSRLNEDILDAGLSECPFVAAAYAVLNIRTRVLRVARGGAPYPLHRSADGRTRLIAGAGGILGVFADAVFDVQTIELQPGDSLLLYTDGLERIVAPEAAARDVPPSLRRAAGRTTGSYRRSASSPGAADLVDSAGASWSPGGMAATAVLDDELAGMGSPEAPAARAAAAATTARRPAAAHELVTSSPWFCVFAQEGPAVALQQLDHRQRALRRMGYPLDDLTALCLRFDI